MTEHHPQPERHWTRSLSRLLDGVMTGAGRAVGSWLVITVIELLTR